MQAIVLARCINFLIPYYSVSSERCDSPDDIINGTISYLNNDSSNTLVGDLISYSCDPESELQGPRQRFCMRNGNWSDEEPVCISKEDILA